MSTFLDSTKRDKEIKYLSESQIAAFFGAIKSHRDRALFRVMYHRGLRVSEIGMLQLADWDPVEGTLWVNRLKGSRSGRYRLVSIEAAALRAWLKIRGEAAGAIFNSRDHRPIGRSRLLKLMHSYCAAAGIPKDKAHPHALKHSCGTHVLAKLRDLTAVQDHLGHRSIQSTEIYARTTPETREEFAGKLKDWGRR